MTDTPIWRLGAAKQAGLIAAGEISAVEAARAAIARIDETNPSLNAIVDDLRDQALAEAAALDAKQAAGEPLGPLHGVPVTIKVNVDQAGRATTNGVAAFRDVIAPEDAPVVANLKRAGAVAVGRSNTPEFSWRAHTDNPLYGPTYNPWDRRLSPGGSSGGASAAVMAGMCALAHGNDIGGSLRFPCYQTGATTVKPGIGRVPAWNPSQTEERGLLAQSMSVQGVIAREAGDVRLAMRALIAPDIRDPWHAPVPFDGPAVDGPIRVAFTKNTYGFDLHPAVSEALDAARAALEAEGYEVVEADLPNLEACALEGYRALLTEIKALLGPSIEADGSADLKGVFANFFDIFPPFEPDDLLRVMAKRSWYAREIALFQEEYPLALTPFLPTPPYAAGRDTEGREGMMEVLGAALYSYSMNVLGLPAGSIAAGRHGDMPINVQIVGRRWREDLVVDACEAVERRVGVAAERLFERGLAL